MAFQILSPLPGKIIEIAVKEGDQVLEGQELMVIEAMKMETPVLSDRNATINKITCSPGDDVEAEQLLFEIK